MPASVPPPPERFDPITAQWQTPGGPLPDPDRHDFDENDQQVTLIGPVPAELADAHEVERSSPGRSPAERMRWAILSILAVGCTAALAAMGLAWWGPALLTAVVAFWAARQATERAD